MGDGVVLADLLIGVGVEEVDVEGYVLWDCVGTVVRRKDSVIAPKKETRRTFFHHPVRILVRTL